MFDTVEKVTKLGGILLTFGPQHLTHVCTSNHRIVLHNHPAEGRRLSELKTQHISNMLKVA